MNLARAPTWTGGEKPGRRILEILVEYFLSVSPLSRRFRGVAAAYIRHAGSLGGFRPCLRSAFKNNEDHFPQLAIFFLSDLLAASSFPLLPDLSLGVAALIYFPWD